MKEEQAIKGQKLLIEVNYLRHRIKRLEELKLNHVVFKLGTLDEVITITSQDNSPLIQSLKRQVIEALRIKLKEEEEKLKNL